MPFLTSDGIRIHYQCPGNGSNVVMVHGLAANMAFWYLNIVPLLTKDFQITLYDLRGHGRSDMPESGYNLATMANDLAALLDEVKIEKAHLVGHSFGGSIILEYALRHPEKVQSLTLADAALYGIQPLHTENDRKHWKIWRGQLAQLGIKVPRRMPNVMHGLLEELADPRWTAVRQRNSSNSFFVPFGLWNGANRTATRWLKLLRTTTAWNEFQDMANLTLERIKKIQHPVLLIVGERSRWLSNSRLVKEALPNSYLVVLPGVGHFHPILKPVIFTHHLRNFLLKGGI